MGVSESAQPDTSRSVMDRSEFTLRLEQDYRRLWLLATSVIQDREIAEDLVQEAAIIAYQKLHTFQAGTNFTAWVAEIVRRCAWNHLKKSRNRATYPVDPSDIDRTQFAAANTVPPPISRYGELAENQEIFDDRVTAALRSLSEDARACVLLRIVEQLSYAEISELMGIPPGTAMSHVHRAKALLRQRLIPSHPHPSDNSH